MKELEQSEQFDLVLFDTPPVLGLADAALIAEHCDGLMLLVSLGGVDRSSRRNRLHASRTAALRCWAS